MARANDTATPADKSRPEKSKQTSDSCAATITRRQNQVKARRTIQPVALTFVNDHHGVFGHQFLRADVEMRVTERIDADDVRLANLHQEGRHHLVELVMADLDAVRVPDGFDVDLFVPAF